MKIKGITDSELRTAVRTASQKYDWNICFKREPERKGNFLHFTLTVMNSDMPGARRSAAGRRIAAACWHAHRDVMWTIFDKFPEALLVTALARYEGKDGFMQAFPATGRINIGSQMMPCQMQDACLC